jgi:hypothetical protein
MRNVLETNLRPPLLDRHRSARVTAELQEVFGTNDIRTVAFVGVRTPLKLGGLRRSVRFQRRPAEPGSH